jgi:hypothetical protein
MKVFILLATMLFTIGIQGQSPGGCTAWDCSNCDACITGVCPLILIFATLDVLTLTNLFVQCARFNEPNNYCEKNPKFDGGWYVPVIRSLYSIRAADT